MMVTLEDTNRMSMDELLSYADKGLLDIEGADLITEAFSYGYEHGEQSEMWWKEEE